MSATELGLVGYPLGHSLSPFIHEQLMAAAGISGNYRLYPLAEDAFVSGIGPLIDGLKGLNVTIPHKERVIGCLDALDTSARLTGSVNTIAGRIGYNTDGPAFASVCPLDPDRPVLILGAGGVSKTMAYQAALAGCRVRVTARRPQQAQALVDALGRQMPQADLAALDSLEDWRQQADGRRWTLLNGTPVGLWPGVAQMPVEPADLAFCGQVFDTIYNPLASRLVLQARSRNIPAGGGLGMLFEQARLAQAIWFPHKSASPDALRQIRKKLATALFKQAPLTLVLSGFMGSGKTTVGRLLAQKLAVPFIDLDDVVASRAGQPIERFFATQGEAAFRQLEAACFKALLTSQHTQVVAAGGGTLVQPAAAETLKTARALVVYLETGLDRIRQRTGAGQGRPLLNKQPQAQVEALYRARLPLYQQTADLTVDGNLAADQVIHLIMTAFTLEEET